MFVDQVVTRFLNLYFYQTGFFSTWPKHQDKNLNIVRTKRAFKMKWRAFFIIFKEVLSKQIKNISLEGESPIFRRTAIRKNTNLALFQIIRCGKQAWHQGVVKQTNYKTKPMTTPVLLLKGALVFQASTSYLVWIL